MTTKTVLITKTVNPDGTSDLNIQGTENWDKKKPLPAAEAAALMSYAIAVLVADTNSPRAQRKTMRQIWRIMSHAARNRRNQFKETIK